MRRQLVPGPVVRLTVIKAKTRPGIEARRGGYNSREATVQERRLLAPDNLVCHQKLFPPA